MSGGGHRHGGSCGHEHAACGHDHSADPEKERGFEASLFPYIDTVRVRCLNEHEDGAIRSVFKPADQKLDRNKYVESNADEQLIIFIPFTGAVKLKSICIIGGEDGSSPAKLKAYINRDDIDFDNVEHLPVVQEWDLLEDNTGALEYPTRFAKFGNVSELTLFIPTNFGADMTRIYYIGLKGEFTNLKREAVNATYELRPQMADHKGKIHDAASRNIE